MSEKVAIKTEQLVGASFSDLVKSQLEARAEVVSGTRDQQALKFMHSNNAWIKLSSSVDTITKQQADGLLAEEITIDKVGGDSELAKRNVLFGGSLIEGQPHRSGIGKDPYSPMEIKSDGTRVLGTDSGKLYNKYASGQGISPKPGITSFEIKSKGSFGQLRECTVQFKIYNLDELEIMQALYFRPGYTVLLEWGHTLYLDNKKELQKNVTPYDSRKWFSKTSMKTIEADLLKKRKDYSNNYDALIGFISNFEWSYNSPDLSYNATIKIITKGSVLDSISVSVDPSNLLTSKDFRRDGDTQRGKQERLSIFHKFKIEIEASPFTTGTGGKGSKRQSFTKDELFLDDTLDPKPKKYTTTFYRLLNERAFAVYKFVHNKELKGSGWWDNDDISNFFIPLSTLLDLINKFVMTTVEGAKEETNRQLIEFYTGANKDKDGNFIDDQTPGTPYKYECKYNTAEKHFSVDPMTVILPKKPITLEYKDGGVDKKYEVRYEARNPSDSDIQKVIAEFQKEHRKGTHDDILNLPIAIHTITGVVNGIIKGDDNKVDNITTLVNSILSKINSALGGVNELTTYYDHTVNLIFIVDKMKTPKSKENVSTLDLVGLRSTLTSLDVSSKLSNQIGNQVSIASSGQGGKSKENVATLLRWNSGYLDRHLRQKTETGKKKTSTEENKQETKEKELKDWIEEFREVLEEFHGNNADYDADGFQNLKGYHKQLMQEYVMEQPTKEKKTIPGVIPIELSFETLGLAGFKIGQAFRVPKGILPRSYSERFGFLITGLSDTIKNNRWYTSISTQFFILEETPKKKVDKEREKVKKVSTLTPTPATILTTSPITASEPAVDQDPAPIINPNHIGASSYSYSNVAQDILSQGYSNGLINQQDRLALVYIKEYIGANPRYINPITGIAEYMLHPAAAQAWFKWRDEMKANGIQYRISSAYRSSSHQNDLQGNASASPGSSPHGFGGALDFGNLYGIVGGSVGIQENLAGRKTQAYIDIATIGAKYGWYNPWRLSDQSGTMEEIWHFEYWGPSLNPNPDIFLT